MTWSVVILLEMRTLVGVPKEGVKMEVCGRRGQLSGGRGRVENAVMERERERYLVVVEVSVDGEAVLLLRLSLRGRLAPPLPPLDQRGVAHAAEEVGLGLQLGVLVPDGTQRRGLVDRRTFRKHLVLILRC